MKAAEQCFPIALYKVVLSFGSVDGMLDCDNRNKDIQQYFYFRTKNNSCLLPAKCRRMQILVIIELNSVVSGVVT